MKEMGKTKCNHLVLLMFLLVLPSFSKCKGSRQLVLKGRDNRDSWMLSHKVPRIKQGQEEIVLMLRAGNVREDSVKVEWFYEEDLPKETPMKKGKEKGVFEKGIKSRGPGMKLHYAFKALSRKGETIRLPEKGYLTVVTKGNVNKIILFAHIGAMFLALVLLLAAGWKCAAFLLKNKGLFGASKLVKVATIVMFIGGVPLGMIVERAVFGTWWEGWPFGRDVTDTKTSVILAVWLLLTWRRPLPGEKEERSSRKWAILVIGMIIFTIIVYLIPHENLKF